MKPNWIILLLIICQLLWAQEEQRELLQPPSSTTKTSVFDVDAEQLQRSKDQIIPQQQFLEQVFEKEINADEYILGPGDQLLIKVWGVLEAQYVSYISPEGYIIIPSVAEISVSGKSLAEGSELIEKALEKSFKNANFSIRLIRMRKFRVFVVGEVRAPGTFFLRAVDRISDAIQLARDLTDWGDETRIEIRRETGETEVIDISEFYLKGNLTQNPLLEGGDIIYVPRIDLQGEFVIIEGNIGSQGIYQTRHQETLFDFLTRLKAINRRSDVENVILFRNDSLKTFNLLEAKSGARTEVLKTGDRIRIPSHRNQVYVRGEVFQPGPYPYLANYHAQDYAGNAGLLETSKSLKNLYVIRAETGEIEKGKKVIVENGDVVVVPRKTRETWKDILSIVTPIVSVALSSWAIIRTTR